MNGKNREISDCPTIGPRSVELGDKGDFALFFARGLDGDLDVLAQGGEKVHEALDGKGASPVAHQGGDVRLLDAEDLAGFGLLEAAAFNETINLQGQLGFQELLFRMG